MSAKDSKSFDNLNSSVSGVDSQPNACDAISAEVIDHRVRHGNSNILEKDPESMKPDLAGGLVAMKIGDGVIVKDSDGKQVINCNFDDDSLSFKARSGDWYKIDRNGDTKKVALPSTDVSDPPGNILEKDPKSMKPDLAGGLVAMKIGDGVIVEDADGKQVINFNFDDDSMSFKARSGDWYKIDRNGDTKKVEPQH